MCEGKFRNIILASDIDGTFVCSSTVTNDRNNEALRYFIDNGGRFSFSSGRNGVDIHYLINNVRQITNMPCVLCNGAFLYNARTDEYSNEYFMNPEAALSILSDIRSGFPDAGFRVSCRSGFLVSEDDRLIIEDLGRRNLLGMTDRQKFSEMTGEKYYKIVVVSDEDTLARVASALRVKYKDYFEFTRSAKTILEIMPVGITKAVQLLYLKELYSRENKDIKLFCIGDFDNDYDMLAHADVSACPDNATDKIKSICKHHLCHCRDGAVAEFISVIEKEYCR